METLSLDEFRNVTGVYAVIGPRGSGKTDFLNHVIKNLSGGKYCITCDDEIINPVDKNALTFIAATENLQNLNFDGYFLFNGADLPENLTLDKSLLNELLLSHELLPYELMFVRPNSTDVKKYTFQKYEDEFN